MSIALYQKYRPKSFEDIVGQDKAVSYFKNIIKKEKDDVGINHAYLITGTRGVGKTTIARIFARELGTMDVDIIEMDTASNRGIDEIRELKEQVKSYPLSSKYRVVIMDEIHMITAPGANALLKTLEEPTPWTIFILCTTDPDKLISTIVSRCQVINLDNPTESNVLSLLSSINKKEGLYIDTADLESIARYNHDSYRDAIGLLDKLANQDKENIKDNLEINIIEESLKLLNFILSKDLKSIFLQIDDISVRKSNIKFEHMYRDIIKLYRALLFLKVGEKVNNDLTENINVKLSEALYKYKDSINSDILRMLLDNESIWNYNSIRDREKFELILINIVSKLQK